MKTRPFLWTCLKIWFQIEAGNALQDHRCGNLRQIGAQLFPLNDMKGLLCIRRFGGPPLQIAAFGARLEETVLWSVLRQAAEVWMWFKTTTCLDRFLMISFCACVSWLYQPCALCSDLQDICDYLRVGWVDSLFAAPKTWERLFVNVQSCGSLEVQGWSTQRKRTWFGLVYLFTLLCI